MGRYHADPELRRVQSLIEQEVERARLADAGDDWITYLIRDPTRPDHRGNVDGTPIYVGQTKEFAHRVRTRFVTCEKYSKRNVDSVERRVADLLHRGVVAHYDVLDRQSTRLASLVSETNWARKCCQRGYNIANKLELQRQAGPPITRRDIPHSWLWPFSLDEAIADGIKGQITCASCQAAIEVALDVFQRTDEPPANLRAVRDNLVWRKEPCTSCGVLKSRFFSLVVD